MKTHYEKKFEDEGTVASLIRIAICGVWGPTDRKGKMCSWLLTSNKEDVTCKSCKKILGIK